MKKRHNFQTILKLSKVSFTINFNKIRDQNKSRALTLRIATKNYDNRNCWQFLLNLSFSIRRAAFCLQKVVAFSLQRASVAHRNFIADASTSFVGE